MERLKRLKRHYTALSFLLYVIVAIVAGAAGIGVASSFGATAGVATALTIIVVGALLSSLAISNEAIKSTEFLTKAILHVSSEHSTVAAPDLMSVPADREFFESLATHVYDLASKSLNMSDSGETENNPQKAVLANMPLPMFALDSNNTVVYVNQAACEYAGMIDGECVGKRLFDIIKLSFASDNSLEEWLKSSSTEKLTGTQSWDRVRLERKDGKVVQCDLAVRFNKDNPEGVEAVVLLFDHTQRYTQDDRGASFVAMAVHELRTPLTVMRGYIEVFEDEIADKLDAEQAEFMRTMSAQAQQLSSFVNNIQNFTRIEDGQFTVDPKEDDWVKILESTLADLELRARVRHKVLKLEVAPDLPHVAVDHTTIKEVLVNLIENAIKYTHSDDPIMIRSYLKDPNTVETVIEDKGIGIPESLIGHIFDKFYRSHRSSKAVGGTGLGLFLSKAIVTAHGGQIWVKSKEGEGTTFGFTVPTVNGLATVTPAADNGDIVKGAHGWIKNHTMYRG